MTKEKRVDVKAVAKAEVMAIVQDALTKAGYKVKDGKDYGFTAGTVIVETAETDVQLKPIAPKAKVERYTLAE